MTRKSHTWAADITGNTNSCPQPFGDRHHGCCPHVVWVPTQTLRLCLEGRALGLNKYHGCHWEFQNSEKLSEHRGGRFEQEKQEKHLKYLKYSGKIAGAPSKLGEKTPEPAGTPHPQPIACTVQMPRDKQADLGSPWDQRPVLTILASSGRWCQACGKPSLG